MLFLELIATNKLQPLPRDLPCSFHRWENSRQALISSSDTTIPLLHKVLSSSSIRIKFPMAVPLFCPGWKLPSTLWVSEVAQSCPTLCDPVNCSPPGSSVLGILQARILEWVAMPLLQGIFPTQGLNPGLCHWRQILYCLSHEGTPCMY